MFQNAYRLPIKLLGIPIKLDMSFLFILPLFAWLIGSQIPTYIELFSLDLNADRLQQGVLPFLLGLLAAIGLFSSVVIHELGHALTARRYGVKTKEITLWFLGGIAQFDEMPQQRGAEAIVAIAGPLTSVLLSGLCWLLWQVSSGVSLFIFSYLTFTNLALAVFNLLPALPLDGGRVMRSLLALALGKMRATEIASKVSQIVAVLLGVYGFLSLNLFVMAVAFFVYSASRAEVQYALMSRALSQLQVRDLMTVNVVSVTPTMTVAQLMRLMFFQKHSSYPVIDDEGTLRGFVKLQNAKDAEEDTLIEAIMSPRPGTIYEYEDALAALNRIVEEEFGRFIVLDHQAAIVGILSKTDLLRAIQQQALNEKR